MVKDEVDNSPMQDKNKIHPTIQCEGITNNNKFIYMYINERNYLKRAVKKNLNILSK